MSEMKTEVLCRGAVKAWETGGRFWRRRIAMAGLVLVVFLIGGCRQNADFDLEESHRPDRSAEWQAEYLRTAIRNLNRLEQFAGGEMRQQIVDRLNQWGRAQSAPKTWKRSPVLESLPAELAELPEIKKLDRIDYTQKDGYYLQQSVWMRDLSNWTRGQSIDDLSRAQAMFDWVVRNLQLAKAYPDYLGPIPQYPWESLLNGQATAVDRAWVFLLMARQQGIDAVVLAVPEESQKDDLKPGGLQPGGLKPWAIGVLNEGQLYLFDPTLGLPLPAAGGVAKDEKGQLTVQPATLSQLRDDPKVLEQIQLDEKYPYPITRAQLDHVVALVEGSPESLSAKMAILEARLKGENKIVLTTRPSELIERLDKVPGLKEKRLWLHPFQVDRIRDSLAPEKQEKVRIRKLPFEVGQSTPLWKGRAWYLKGKLEGEQSATSFLQMARPSNRILSEKQSEVDQATSPEEAKAREELFLALVRAKEDAGYWLGLISYGREDAQSAVDYFARRTLEDYPGGVWTQGAIYNLGRTFEQIGSNREAAKVFRAAPPSPVWYGEQLRAKWLDPPQVTLSEKPEEEPEEK